MSNKAYLRYESAVEIAPYLVGWYRQGEKLGVRIYHNDPLILEKVANKLHLRLIGEIEAQQHNNYTEMRCSIFEWSDTGCVINFPVSAPAGFAYHVLPASGCVHEFEAVHLFTSSYQKCIKCGKEVEL